MAKSHAAEDLPIWEEVYRRAFPDFLSMDSFREYGEWQKAGIDRGITLKNSKVIHVDEKVRSKPYEDIALEYWSVEEKQIPGWVCKPLRADYIAYLVAPLGVCHFLPVIQLQNAWVKNGDMWKKQYGSIRAKNKNYNTVCCCVPWQEVYKKVGRELRVTFERFDIESA